MEEALQAFENPLFSLARRAQDVNAGSTLGLQSITLKVQLVILQFVDPPK